MIIELRAKRLALEIKQSDVAKALGVARVTVKNWEKKHTRISYEMTDRYSDFLKTKQNERTPNA